MRLFKALFMLLMLVTFSTGFGTTTADLKQNSKTEIVAFDFVKSAAVETVNVVSFNAVSYEAQSFQSLNETLLVLAKAQNPNLQAVIRDVGWQSNLKNYKQVAFTENVLNYKDLHYYNKNKLFTNRIRNNPFTNSLPFYITNRS